VIGKRKIILFGHYLSGLATRLEKVAKRVFAGDAFVHYESLVFEIYIDQPFLRAKEMLLHCMQCLDLI
jgi:hypothetical protein